MGQNAKFQSTNESCSCYLTENMQKQNERPGVNMGCMSLFAKTISARKMEMYVEGILDESQGIP